MLLVLALTGCKDFFYSEVTYKGPEQNGLLTVNAEFTPDQTPMVYVSRSYFFTDTAQIDSVQYGVNKTNRYAGYLKNAYVSMRVNNEIVVPFQMQVNKPPLYQYSDSLVYYTPAREMKIHAGDTVRLMVGHDEYGHAEAMQVCPSLPNVRFVDMSLTENGQIKLYVLIDQYEGNHTDVLSLNFYFDELQGRKIVNGDTIELKANTVSRKVYVYTMTPAFRYIYNYEYSSGFCGGRVLYYALSQATETARSAQLFIDQHLLLYNEVLAGGKLEIDKMSVICNAEAMTWDGFQYSRSFLQARKGFNAYDEDLSHLPATEDGAIPNLMEDLINELGNQEDFQVFCNMKGTPNQAVGHFSLRQQLWQKISYTREDGFSVTDAERVD